MAKKTPSEIASESGPRAEPARPTRKPRTPNEYRIFKQDTLTFVDPGKVKTDGSLDDVIRAGDLGQIQVLVPVSDMTPFADTDSALAGLQASGLLGTFAVVLVKRVVTAAEETIKKIKLT